MSRVDRLGGRLGRALAEAAEEAIPDGADDGGRSATFVRGLTIGALVGAAIAGSTLWQRRHRAPASTGTTAAADPASDLTPPVTFGEPRP